MALNIKNPRAHRLAREVSAATGESMSDVVTQALERRLKDVRRLRDVDLILREVQDIQEFVRSLPELDERSDDEILGYDRTGLPE